MITLNDEEVFGEATFLGFCEKENTLYGVLLPIRQNVPLKTILSSLRTENETVLFGGGGEVIACFPCSEFGSMTTNVYMRNSNTCVFVRHDVLRKLSDV